MDTQYSTGVQYCTGFLLAVRKNCVYNVKPSQCPFLNVNDSLEGVGEFQLGIHFCYV